MFDTIVGFFVTVALVIDERDEDFLNRRNCDTSAMEMLALKGDELIGTAALVGFIDVFAGFKDHVYVKEHFLSMLEQSCL